MLVARLVFLTLGMATMARGVGVTVGVFAAPGIFGRSWNRHAPNGCGHAEGQARHVCNLAVYKSAIDTAAALCDVFSGVSQPHASAISMTSE